MKVLALILISAVSASADLRGYNLPSPTGPSFGSSFGSSSGSTFGSSSGSSFGSSSGSSFGSSSGSSFGSSFGQSVGPSSGGCSPGQVRHVDGRCVTPRENRRVFLYEVPSNVVFNGAPVNIPEPTVETNIVLIRTPEGLQGPDPVVVPPPRQQHVVYVLNKQSEHDQRVIEVTAPPPSDPEVYFVNYAEGENPTLPSGVDLQSALGAATQGGGQVIGDSGSGVGGGIGGSIGGGIGGGSSGSISLGGGGGFGGSGGSISLGGGGGFGGSSGFSSSGGSSGFGGSGSFGSGSGFGGFGGSSGGGSISGSYTPPTQPSNLYTSP
ncbi:keratin, type I cytoskeletal 9-like [Penaeus vannamei]|uniref:keratin, type I cytoskeletal 9-like n=1 Tax=Penaeus vannamei TaxID=6689 RepID=UPI00387FA5E0